MKVSVIIPSYNEIKTLPQVLEKISALPLDLEIIAVDDGSKDGTLEWLEKAKASGQYPRLSKVLAHSSNFGKGAALRTGFAAASGEIIVIQDADLEYNPDCIPQLVKPIEEGRAEIVYGSRMLSKESGTYSIIYLLGNKFVTWVANTLCGGKFTDSYTCYKAFKSDIVKNMNLISSGFEIEGEISAIVALRKYKFLEIPVTYIPRSRAEGKKINWKDAVKGIITIIRTCRREKNRT